MQQQIGESSSWSRRVFLWEPERRWSGDESSESKELSRMSRFDLNYRLSCSPSLFHFAFCILLHFLPRPCLALAREFAQ